MSSVTDDESTSKITVQVAHEVQRLALTPKNGGVRQQQSPTDNRPGDIPLPILPQGQRLQPTSSDEVGAGEPGTAVRAASPILEAPAKSLPSFSSPISDPTASLSELKNAHGTYLEFLSLFLGTARQVDIASSKRNAFSLFLMQSLEKSYFAFAQRYMPKELELVQVVSADELEPQVWKAFLCYVPDYGPIARNEMANLIRHIAVHRYRYDTTYVRAAVDEAAFLQDDTLIEQIDMILRVFYADANPDSRYPVTNDERRLVDDLLWPPQRPVETFHQFLDRVQNLGEKASFKFCQLHLPQMLVRQGMIEPECRELSSWQENIKRQKSSESSDPKAASLYLEVLGKLEKVDTRWLRNAASHREPMGIHDDENQGTLSDIQQVVDYVRALGDESTATQIEQLRTESMALLLRKQKEWMDPKWCDTRDWKRIYRTIDVWRDHWYRQRYEFSREPYYVDILTLCKLYTRSENRLYAMICAKGWLDQLVRTPPPLAPPEPESVQAEGFDTWWIDEEWARSMESDSLTQAAQPENNDDHALGAASAQAAQPENNDDHALDASSADGSEPAAENYDTVPAIDEAWAQEDEQTMDEVHQQDTTSAQAQVWIEEDPSTSGVEW
ncbi:MAG: hypothetical protein L6R39_004561 [Caloplaca ligustica]|nr:MAG: hypothetical protein L6R39_004561 [Caloplaca ligustica]